MIELTIPFNTTMAFLLCIAISTGLFLMIIGIVSKRHRHFILLGLAVLFVFDAASAFFSGCYSTTPTNDHYWRTAYDVTCYSTEPYHKEPCTFPPNNPYEIQPLHPINWAIGSLIWFDNLMRSSWKITVV
jgi:hypothetical protein